MSQAENSSGMGRTSSPNPTFDLPWLIQRVKDICMNKPGIWDTIRDEDYDIATLYKKYYFAVGAITPLCTWIGLSVFGAKVPFGPTIRVPVISGLIQAIIQYAIILATPYLISLILSKVAPNFTGPVAMKNVFKAIIFSMAPVSVVGALNLFPIPMGLPTLISLGAAIYAIYLYVQSLVPLVGVPQEKRPGFVVLTIATGILVAIAMMIVTFILAIIGLGGIDATAVSSGYDQEIDYKKLEEGFKEFEKVLPRP